MKACTLLVLTIGTAGWLSAGTTYIATSIGYLPGGTSVTPIQVNNKGQVCGYGDSSSATQEVFLWSPGTGMVDIGPGQAAGVNDSGQVVYNNFDTGLIYVWSSTGGTVTVGAGQAAGINNSGQVAGTAASNSQAFLWSAGTGMVSLGTLPGATYSSANAMNNLGQVVGFSGTQSFLYTPGTGMTAIPIGIATGINNHGVVVGHYVDDAQTWSSSTGLVTLPRLVADGFGEGVAINDSGVAIGAAAVSSSDWMGQAVVYSGGTVTNLNSVTQGLPSGVSLLEGMSINNPGQIIAWAIGAYYLLTPNPGFSKCDLNQDWSTDALDAQGMINEALGVASPGNDLNLDGAVNVVDVQIVIDAALNLGCAADTSQKHQLMTGLAGRHAHLAAGTSVTLPPSVPRFMPADGATGVALNSAVTIESGRPIDPASVRTGTGNQSLAVFMTPSGGPRVEVAGSLTFANTGTSGQIVFTPASPFEPNSSVTVYTAYNAHMTDYAGNPLEPASATFTTAAARDTARPHVTSVTPPDGATAVGQNTPIVLTFDRPLHPGTLLSLADLGDSPGGAGFSHPQRGPRASAPLDCSRITRASTSATTLRLFSGSTPIDADFTRSADSRTITLTGSLPAGAPITVVATGGVTDLVGHRLVDFSSSFTTAPAAPPNAPGVVSMRPGNGAAGVPANSPISLVTSAPMDAATVAGALNVVQNGIPVSGTTQVSADGKSIVFTPGAGLAAGASVQVFLSSAAIDIYGNRLDNYTAQFTVQAGQTAATPTVVAMSPANMSSIDFLNPAISVRFDMPIDATTVTDSTFSVMQNDIVANSGTLSLFDPYTIRFVPNPRTLSTSGQSCYRLLMTDGIRGTNGVAFAGSVGQYHFCVLGAASLVDDVSPTVTGLAPADSYTVGDNTSFRATFSKPIDPLTVNASTVNIGGGGRTAIPSAISFDGANRSVTIVPLARMPDNASMTITIDGVTDLAGNAAAPLTARFTTLAGPDITAPTVISTSVDSGARDLPSNSAIVFHFSKAMDSRTLTGTNFYLYDCDFDVYIPVSYRYSADGFTAAIAPTSPLPAGHAIQMGVRNARDMAGNAITPFAVNFPDDVR